jgi:hypothetical protein
MILDAYFNRMGPSIVISRAGPVAARLSSRVAMCISFMETVAVA